MTNAIEFITVLVLCMTDRGLIKIQGGRTLYFTTSAVIRQLLKVPYL
jgi:hypothetical protein